MTSPTRFLDDPEIALALDRAAADAVAHLATAIPELDGPRAAAYANRLRRHMADLLARGRSRPDEELPLLPVVLGDDAFGDPFELEELPLPRSGTGYAVQRLNTDTLLDQKSRDFLPVRDPGLQALFPSFRAAYQAARAWITERGTNIDADPLAIVPAAYDDTMERHVLVYGVLASSP